LNESGIAASGQPQNAASPPSGARQDVDYDYIVIGSGFGGSVSALRLVEKGYRVLLLEKGRALKEEDFPRTNWDLKRWLWAPFFGLEGPFRMTFFRHITVLSGVGLGGGSLVYANTLATPDPEFFHAPSWAGLADWTAELLPHYATVRRMLGASTTPFTTTPDRVLREIAEEDGRPEAYAPTEVGVYFGDAGKTVPDPYFGGAGPARTGCVHCGGCMLGCRFGAKNTLDRNYLHLARARGLEILTETEAVFVGSTDGGGYRIETETGVSPFDRKKRVFRSRGVVLSAGVLGTLSLLHRMKRRADGLPRLSDRLGRAVRTNSEAIIGVISRQREDLSRGLTIGSIVTTGPGSSVEPVRYPAGSGFFRLLMAPHVEGTSAWQRIWQMILFVVTRPIEWLRVLLVPDLSRYTMMLLVMQHDDAKLRLVPGRWRQLATETEGERRPTASLPAATAIARRVATKIEGTPVSILSETLFNVPTTAHILGGCCMGDSAANGVIDHRHRLFGYDDFYVIDGSAVSAEPGVNPALTIAALAERAMSFIPPRKTTLTVISPP
jgi:cholesterol oxidase